MNHLRPPRSPRGRSCRRAGPALATAALAALALAITGTGAAWAAPASPHAPAATRATAGTAAAATTSPPCGRSVQSYAAWMGYLSSCLKDHKLSSIMIPGSHDSGTYALPPADTLGITQDDDLTAQLNDGMRSLDIRVEPGVSGSGAGYYVHHGSGATDEVSTWLDLPRVFSDIAAWAQQPGHEHEVILLNLDISQDVGGHTAPFPTAACQSFGNQLGGALVTPNDLAQFGTNDPAQVTLGQLWSLPDPNRFARVIMNNDACLGAAVPSAELWPDTRNGYYANQCTANGEDQAFGGLQSVGITKLVLQAARTRASVGGYTEPTQLGPPKPGGLYDLEIEGTPALDCLSSPKSMVGDEQIALAVLHNVWLAEPSVRQNLNIVAGDFVEDTSLTADAIATDTSLDAGPGFEVAAQAGAGNPSGAGHLWSAGFDAHGDWGPGLKAGTSPAITALPGGGYEMTFEGSDGHLWTNGTAGNKDWGPTLIQPGTNPAITALSGGGYEIAYQGGDAHLWTAGTAGSKDWGPGMMPGTSPAITALFSGYEMAFQASDGHLWTNGTAGSHDWGPGMMPGTSPAIAAVTGPPGLPTYEVAFQASDGHLWSNGTAGTKDWGPGMMPGTSPAITALPALSQLVDSNPFHGVQVVGGGYQMAFQDNNGHLWTNGSAGAKDWGPGMMTGTSPAITGLTDGTFEVAFQDNNGNLASLGSVDGFGGTGLKMMPGTSPSIAAIQW